jgi:protein TonB
MGYIERHSVANRGGMLVAAAALNGLVIVGLITAFNGIPFRALVDPHLQASQEPTETRMPLETPKPRVHPPIGEPRHDKPKPDEVFIDLTLKPDGFTLPPDPPGGGGGVVIKPQPQPPQLTPKAAAPLGNPGGWVGEADYPGTELRAGHAGTTRFRLAIGVDGRVAGCEIIGSSGWPGLDEATCRLVSARARFRPASDGSGAPATGTFASAIRWVIPE